VRLVYATWDVLFDSDDKLYELLSVRQLIEDPNLIIKIGGGACCINKNN
jgi:hypothetical protein